MKTLPTSTHHPHGVGGTMEAHEANHEVRWAFAFEAAGLPDRFPGEASGSALGATRFGRDFALALALDLADGLGFFSPAVSFGTNGLAGSDSIL